ncbi:transposase zinc-binding domain-containing protein [Archangium gephyra]|uniref:transposase zinc-binding domain-containing protein n=1 Tax=Archangium gephyra TaxID=48 RepID=UPI003B7BFDF9
MCPGEVWLGRGLPRYVERDFARYLECGVLAHGFARVRCESCKDELLVAFSCKGRGVCPSCNAKRAHVTAAHLVERVLPHVPYRHWTLSFPHRVRWVLLKDAGLLSDVLTLFLRAVFALLRRRARRQGPRGGQPGAVSFIQFFGSALQVTPHFHSLVPDGVFVPREGGVHFEGLAPPTHGEVEQLLRVVRHRVLRLLGRRGTLARGRAAGISGALAAAAAELDGGGRAAPSPKATPVRRPGGLLPACQHAPSRQRQAGAGAAVPLRARGALALERLSRAEDGRIAYRMKRPLPDGTTHLLFTGLEARGPPQAAWC